MATHYQILGLSQNATQAEIKAAFRRLARTYHPDHRHHPDATRKFVQVKRAYDVLSNPAKRRRYDLILSGARIRPEGRKAAARQTAANQREDDRKYGTRHRFTNPPPTRAEQEKRYHQMIDYYSVFSRRGMRLPRQEWWKRFDVVLREIFHLRMGRFGLLVVAGIPILGIYHFLRYGANFMGLFWLMFGIFQVRWVYRNAVRSVAEQKAKR